MLALDEIGDKIVGSIEMRSRPTSATTRSSSRRTHWTLGKPIIAGVWHMYRFNRADNEQAHISSRWPYASTPRSHEPTLASLCPLHEAFQRWGEREQETAWALEAAERSLIVDDRDPAAHWAMGRALWLRGRRDQSLAELERAVGLSPSFAHGHYALAFVHCQWGDPRAAIQSSDHARHLSPLDPLLSSMLAARATALVRLRQFEEAANWAAKAAAQPNTHVNIRGIAAHCLALADRTDEARAVIASIHKVLPDYRFDDLFSTFRPSPDAEALFRRGAKRIGIG